ncbi:MULTISPECIES: 5'-nucleotidase C-terminal domain-containing protein [Phaeobacter]|uniref:2',3'-cyclic-nucleotide 2'-phosphodiesterase CpdB n=1 Tax=Phaeobacter piscinae TaxID=1580596 RepID=A0ABN5DHF0_9RHOB|nr:MULTISPECIES: 5'-nucleotidase C-terminal domain-containing protein [Phaeobacter]ATG36917.1 2',3'-cyclic-nucleotide 2'-phosphodiesterase CpdB [Phaeobacter piscinae]AUQ87438.1 2',3'-cyclic-nucleotide 2'-phosphodiesterase CpdB [Phaeobacter piscinae]AUR25321.1 2',3'-cyclic-nucleotide 2'-phosphodiesterase CpdB [Phaeobacter piscinae]KII13806.1 2', 3'-cyclic nucleotide 2'-phosphodiesterase [Phaeobacter sp. S60]
MTGSDKAEDSKVGSLRILATTDLHANLLSHDYYSDQPDPALGLSRVATLIAQARREAAANGAVTLLLDNGDSIFGTPIAERPLELSDVRPAPVARAFDLLNYDAIGLGNHDFDFGLDQLRQALLRINCPVLCSNMRALNPQLSLPFCQSVVLERVLPGADNTAPLRIGLLSVLPMQTLKWAAHALHGKVTIDDMVQSASKHSAALRRNGCDIVVALAHTGIGETGAAYGIENALHPLANLGSLDAIIGGHTHLTLPDPRHPVSVPIVMPGAHGSHLGVIDLSIRLSTGRWDVTYASSALRPIAERRPTCDTDSVLTPLVDEDTSVIEALAEDHAETRSRMAQPVGRTSQPLHSYFTFLGHDQALALVARAQAAAVRPALTDTVASNLPLLSAAAPGKFGARSGPSNYTDVPVGQMYMRHVVDIQPFPNELRTVVLNGAQLRAWLEMSAGLFNQIAPGSSGEPLLDNDRAGHNFDVIFGVQYDIDVSAPARFAIDGELANPDSHRIRNLRWKGAPVRDSQHFAVAVSSYRIGGGGNFAMAQSATPLPIPPLRVRDVIRDYVAGRLDRDPLEHAPAPWRLVSHASTEAEIFTGPGARAYLSDLDPSRHSLRGTTPDGFLRIGVRL